MRGRGDAAATGVDAVGSVRWSATVPGWDAVGVMLEPEGESVYVADGWGVAYPSLAVRRLALGTGEQRALVRLGNQARCLGLSRADPSTVLPATDRILFLLDRDTLEKGARWREGVPRFTDTIVRRAEAAFLACAGARTVTIFDLETGTPRKRRRVGAGVILREHGDEVLACCAGTGTVWRVSGAGGEARRLLADAPFAAAEVVGDELWVLAGERMSVEEHDWGARLAPRDDGGARTGPLRSRPR